MASNAAVAWALAVLKHLPSKHPVTAETVEFYALGLDDVPDDALRDAVRRAAQTATFLPTPAELRRLASAARVRVVDHEAVLDAIAAMGVYLPTTGTTYPRIEAVRQRLGDAVAAAYAEAGGERVFTGNPTTRDIARQAFARELRELVALHGADAVFAPLEAAAARPALSGASVSAVVDDQPPPHGNGRGLLPPGASRTHVGSGPRPIGALLADAGLVAREQA